MCVYLLMVEGLLRLTLSALFAVFHTLRGFQDQESSSLPKACVLVAVK